MNEGLQWGGRFTQAPDPALLAFGSSLVDDLPLAPFDVRVSLAHVTALRGFIGDPSADALVAALETVAREIAAGTFDPHALGAFEDIHGAIDARVRSLAPEAGASLHAGRSRNDQVATGLALYASDRARRGAELCASLARTMLARAESALANETVLAATTHGQPAQPVLLAFWLCAAAEPFVRAMHRFTAVSAEAMRFCPLGSGAVSGSTLPLDRRAAAGFLGFDEPSRNAMDAIGNRDAILDAAHGFVRAALDASRVAAEIVVWASPAFGYVRLGDRSSTGSSLMPQKRNPDVFELVRGAASELNGLYAGAIASLTGLPPSYYRDLQQTKRMTLQCCERGLALLDAFVRAFDDTAFDAAAMNARAADGYTTATDLAEAMMLEGVSAREAHARTGALVLDAETQSRPLESAPDALTSVRSKRTSGSTAPVEVRRSIDALRAEIDATELAQ